MTDFGEKTELILTEVGIALSILPLKLKVTAAKSLYDFPTGPCAGIDLNRNFGYRWGGQGSSQQPCRETYAGQGPFSEPETNSIKEFIMKKPKEFKVITFQSTNIITFQLIL